MSKLDNEIQEALQTKDLSTAAEKITSELKSLRCWHRFITTAIMVYVLLFTAVIVISAIMFFRSEATDIKNLILWATIFSVSFVCTGLIKMFWWIIHSKLTVIKKIKLLELQMIAGHAAEKTTHSVQT